jgi:hypothetical protein
MRRLPLAVRRLSASFAVFLLFFSTHADVYASSHCAHHAAVAPAGETHDHHAKHGGQAESPADSETDSSDLCSCLGTCASTTALVAPAAKPVVLLPPVYDDAATGDAHAHVLPASPRHLIPFSTAPPFVS